MAMQSAAAVDMPSTKSSRLDMLLASAALPENHPHAVNIIGKKPAVNLDIDPSPSLGLKLRHSLSRISLRSIKAGDRLRRKQSKGLSLRDILRDTRASDGGYDSDAQSVAFKTPVMSSSTINATEFVLEPSRQVSHPSGYQATSAFLSTRRRVSQSGKRTSGKRTSGKRTSSAPMLSTHMASDSPTRKRSISWTVPLETKCRDRAAHDHAIPWPLSPCHEALQETVDEDSDRSTIIHIRDVSTMSPQASTLPFSAIEHIELVGDSPQERVGDFPPHLYNMGISQRLQSPSCPSEASSIYSCTRSCLVETQHNIDSIVKPGMDSRSVDENGTIASCSRQPEKSCLQSVDHSPLTTAQIVQLPTLESRITSEDPNDSLASSSASPNRYSCSSQLQGICSTVQPSSSSRASSSTCAGSPSIEPRLASDDKVSHRRLYSLFQRCRPSKQHERSKFDRTSVLSLFHSRSKRKSAGQIGSKSMAMLDGAADPRPSLSLLGRKSRHRSMAVTIPVTPERGPGSSSALQAQHSANLLNPRFAHVPSDPAIDLAMVNDTIRQRHGSLEAYEKNLSAQGDDRRRKSTVPGSSIDVSLPSERQDSATWVQRPLLRAAPLRSERKSGDQLLMSKALARHREEKAALCRSSRLEDVETREELSRSRNSRIRQTLSKRSITPRQSPAQSEDQSPVFASSFGPSSSPTRPMSALDDIDPLDTFEPAQARKTRSMHQLGQTESRSSVVKHKGSLAFTTESRSSGNVMGRHLSKPPRSWSRFPSHNRLERNASAGLADNVLTRDFAHEPRTSTDSDGLNNIKTRKSGKWSYHSHLRSLRQICRYYSTLLTTSTAQNRRTSVAVGGTFEHPELEVLPPVFALQAPSASVGDRTKQHMHNMADHLKSEAHELHQILTDHTVHPRHHAEHSSADILDGLTDARPEFEMTELMLDGAADYYPDIAPAIRYSKMYQQLCERPEETMTHEDMATSSQWTDRESIVPIAERRPLSEVHEETAELSMGLALNDLESAQTTMLADDTRIPTPKTDTRTKPLTSVIAIRHFPSVTVIDDRKGHWRSISLLSRQSSGSGRSTDSSSGVGRRASSARSKVYGIHNSDGEEGYLAASTQDLLSALDAVEAREREKISRFVAT